MQKNAKVHTTNFEDTHERTPSRFGVGTDSKDRAGGWDGGVEGAGVELEYAKIRWNTVTYDFNVFEQILMPHPIPSQPLPNPFPTSP